MLLPGFYTLATPAYFMQEQRDCISSAQRADFIHPGTGCISLSREAATDYRCMSSGTANGLPSLKSGILGRVIFVSMIAKFIYAAKPEVPLRGSMNYTRFPGV